MHFCSVSVGSNNGRARYNVSVKDSRRMVRLIFRIFRSEHYHLTFSITAPFHFLVLYLLISFDVDIHDIYDTTINVRTTFYLLCATNLK